MSNNITLFTGDSNAIVPLAGGKLPSYLADKDQRAALAAINEEIQTQATFPVLSIKGKVFTLKKDGESRILTRADDADEVLQSIQITVLRANSNARVFYAGAYTEGAEGEAAAPTCYSNNGQTPAADARDKQHHKCAICPHSVWGTGSDGKGTACTVNTRLAIAAPELLTGENPEATLLRVPAGSRAGFADIIKAAKRQGVPYRSLVLKVGFDPTAPAPKLTFKPVGLLSDDAYAAATALAGDELTLEMCGLTAAQQAAPTDTADDAIARAKAAVAAKPATKTVETPIVDEAEDEVVEEEAPAPAPAPKPVAKKVAAKKVAAPAPAPAEGAGMIDDLDALLAATDD